MGDPDIMLSRSEFKELVRSGYTESGETVVAVRNEDWLPSVVELLNE